MFSGFLVRIVLELSPGSGKKVKINKLRRPSATCVNHLSRKRLPTQNNHNITCH